MPPSKFENEGEFNFWFSKWSGDGSRFNAKTSKSDYRCVIERDAGRTKANKYSVFCIHFVHGKCIKGKDCQFLHRLPMDDDETETTQDCFGRDKFRLDREDMGGIGSFERRTRCLYVGNIEINDHMEPIVRKHFSEWGEIEHSIFY